MMYSLSLEQKQARADVSVEFLTWMLHLTPETKEHNDRILFKKVVLFAG